MKNIYKNTLKTTLFCFLVLLSSCEAEKDFVKNKKLTIRNFSMKEVSNKVSSKLVEAVNEVKNMHSITTNENAKIVFEEKTGLYFDDEKGVYIEMDSKKSYTFPIIRTSTSEKVKNICFKEKQNGNFDVYIIRYDFTKEEAEQLTKEQQMQREKVYMKLINSGTPLATFNIVCIEILEGIEVSEFEGVMDGDATETHIQWVTIFQACYNEGGGETDGFNGGLGDGVDTGNNTGGGVNDDSPVITGSIIGDTEAQVPGNMPLGWRIKYFEERLDKDFELPIYNAHPELREFLASLNCNSSSQQFVLEIVYAITNTPTVEYTVDNFPGKENGMSFEWWKDKDYISENLKPFGQTPNALEILLFSIFPEKVIFHIGNSNEALERASQLVQNGTLTGIHNGKADAFRHTYWNAMDASEIGSYVTKLFTDAHEWNSDNHPLETQMDIFNNNIGRQIGEPLASNTPNSLIASIVLTYIQNGFVKYLTPIGDNGEILSNTSLKPTNQ